MEIVTSWTEQGLQQGVLNYTLRLLKHKFGEIDSEIETQVRGLSVAQLQDLGEALFDFSTIADVERWLEGSRE